MAMFVSGSTKSTGSFGHVYVDKAVAVDSITFNTPHVPSTGALAPMIEADSGNTSNTHLRFYTSSDALFLLLCPLSDDILVQSDQCELTVCLLIPNQGLR